MAAGIGDVIAGTIDRLVRWVVVPITSAIPVLARNGILLLIFGAMWLALGVGLATDRGAIDHLWQALAALPLPLQAIAWLLFLPLTAALWVWGTDWPEALRLVVIAGLAAWNVLVFLPRREPSTGTPTASWGASQGL